jgi:hypothetical protein
MQKTLVLKFGFIATGLAGPAVPATVVRRLHRFVRSRRGHPSDERYDDRGVALSRVGSRSKRP